MTNEEKWELEQELQDVLVELEQLYDIERRDVPYVNDRVRGEIYFLHDRRDEIKKLLAAANPFQDVPDGTYDPKPSEYGASDLP